MYGCVLDINRETSWTIWTWLDRQVYFPSGIKMDKQLPAQNLLPFVTELRSLN